jgi:hypothetical protein
MGREERVARFSANLFSVRYRTLTRWAEHVLGKIKELSNKNVHASNDVLYGFITSMRFVVRFFTAFDGLVSFTTRW